MGTILKALTFSYDDGITQDERLVALFNKYNLKCTFNLNSGIQSYDDSWTYMNKVDVHRMDKTNLVELYKGHEIAIHGQQHLLLPDIPRREREIEITEDIKSLESMFGQKMEGMAYAFGAYDDEVIKILKDNGIKYARTTMETNDFDLQTDLLRYKSTCHHDYKDLMELAEDFVDLKPQEPKLFYVWGHSYEFDGKENWDKFEEFLKYISNRNDIFYGTNIEVFKKFNMV